MLDRLESLAMFVRNVAGRLSWLPPTLARLSLGWVFVESGWGKLHSLEKVTEYFQSLGIPAPQIQAPFAAGTEFVCGVLLLAGLLTRLAAIPLIVTMAVAILTARRPELNGLSDLFGFIEFLYLVMLGSLAATGAGPLSLDHLATRRLLEPGPGAAPSPGTS